MSVTFAQIHFGWGKTESLITDEDPVPLKKVCARCQKITRLEDDICSCRSQAAYSAEILYVTILSSSKASTALFYRTITVRSSLWMSYALLAVILLWTPVAIILVAVRCDRYPWQNIDGQCDVLVRCSTPD
jgi:hypothetical protein